jgi:hypothetical protein
LDEGLSTVIAGLGANNHVLIRTLLLLLVFEAPGGAWTSPPREKPTEYEVKAAYLFNFAKFVKWRSAARQDTAFQICVLGDDPFGDVLQKTVEGEKIDGRGVQAKRIKSVAEASGCSIVFVSSSERAKLRSILAQLSSTGALTVSDLLNFTETGGMIQFVAEEHRIRFEVNLAATEHAGLNVSSELLRVASAVRRKGD